MLRLVLVALAALVLGGCGGDSTQATSAHKAAPASRPLSESEREEQERANEPGKRLSAADRVAYYQIATTSGLLRARAASVLAGRDGTPRGTLAAGRARLERLEPDSTSLAGLGKELGTAIDRLLRAESKPAARLAIASSDAINADLTRFSKGKAVKLLLPD